MKKVISLLTVALLVTLLLSVTALAHGHGGSYAGQVAATRYAVCTVEDCNTTYAHQHDGTWYCGHTLNDGHEYHEVCGVSGCTLTYAHEHDGEYCFPHTANDGHTYHWYGHDHGDRHH
jgi:predicted carbohydrate-binding protein with CBM5 and CBM33 domain